MLQNTTIDITRRSRRRPLELACAAIVAGLVLITPVQGRQSAEGTMPLAATASSKTAAAATIKRGSSRVSKLGGKKTVAALAGKTVAAKAPTTIHSPAAKVSSVVAKAPAERDDTVYAKKLDAAVKLLMAQREEQIPADDSLVTEVLPVKYAVVNSLVRVLHETFGPNTRTLRISHENVSNSLVIAGTAEKLDKIKSVVQSLDKPTDDVVHTHIFRITYAKAEQLASLLNSALRNEGAVADLRTNSILFTGTDKNTQEAQRLISNLDIQVAKKD